MAGTLSSDTPEQEHAKAVVVEQVERLHGRIWNGKAKDAHVTLERIGQVMLSSNASKAAGQGIRRRAGSGPLCASSTAISPTRAPG